MPFLLAPMPLTNKKNMRHPTLRRKRCVAPCNASENTSWLVSLFCYDHPLHLKDIPWSVAIWRQSHLPLAGLMSAKTKQMLLQYFCSTVEAAFFECGFKVLRSTLLGTVFSISGKWSHLSYLLFWAYRILWAIFHNFRKTTCAISLWDRFGLIYKFLILDIGNSEKQIFLPLANGLKATSNHKEVPLKRIVATTPATEKKELPQFCGVFRHFVCHLPFLDFLL